MTPGKGEGVRAARAAVAATAREVQGLVQTDTEYTQPQKGCELPHIHLEENDMNLDYDDFIEGGGSMSIRRRSTWLPYHMYKHTPEFRQKQMWKPQLDTRNPSGTTVKRWHVQGGTCVETRGTRSWFGQCECGCWIYSQRDASGPEFRGRGNPGPRGRWPKYCTRCRERRQQEQADKARREVARLRRDPYSRKRDFEFRERF